MEDNVLFPSLFEDDYLFRSVSNAILTQPDVALTELVANAWDAGLLMLLSQFQKISINNYTLKMMVLA